MTGDVLGIAWLFADQHDVSAGRSFAEDGLRGTGEQRTAAAPPRSSRQDAEVVALGHVRVGRELLRLRHEVRDGPACGHVMSPCTLRTA
jgi:hypothetical protein